MLEAMIVSDYSQYLDDQEEETHVNIGDHELLFNVLQQMFELDMITALNDILDNRLDNSPDI